MPDRNADLRRLSVVVPTLDEAARIAALLDALAPARAAGAEVLVVDGGSRDDTCARAAGAADRVLTSEPGRGRQLALGIAAARGDCLWLLHADSVIAPGQPQAIVRALGEGGAAWGRFDVAIDGGHPLLRVIAVAMNLRTRLTGIVTGDHGIFCRRDALERAGGFPLQPLMEDIEVSRRLKAVGWPVPLRPHIRTSGRRWQKHGLVRTMLLMWRFRLRYFMGASPERLAREYYGG